MTKKKDEDDKKVLKLADKKEEPKTAVATPAPEPLALLEANAKLAKQVEELSKQVKEQEAEKRQLQTYVLQAERKRRLANKERAEAEVMLDNFLQA